MPRFRACLIQTNVFRFLFAVCTVSAILGMLVSHEALWRTVVTVSRVKWTPFLPSLLSPWQRTIQLQCPNVLTNMVRGRWRSRPYRKSEFDDVQWFLHIAREQHFLPYNLQRPDNRCGNVSFEGLGDNNVHSLLWFRALCDVDGDAACCYGNRCQPKSLEECRCPDCYDLRSRVHGELADWTPSEPTCQMVVFERVEDVCQALQGMTVYFIGDSLIRHLYLAVLQLLRANTRHGPMFEYTPPGMRMACTPHTMYLGMCVNVLDRETWECGHTVKLKFMEYPKIFQVNLTLEAVAELSNVSDAMLVLGVGIHDNLDVYNVTHKVLLPVWEAISKMAEPRPSLLWASVHAPGLLKTPRVPSQSRAAMLAFNEQVRAVLVRHGIPEFHTFPVTDGTLSYDGLHYGQGVNRVKAQIFLNYLLDLRSRSKVK